MHLLGRSMRPVGRNIVRCQLHADPPLSSRVDDAVPIVVLEDVPAEDARPERALGMQVSRFSGLRITMQGWPQRSRCLLTSLRDMPIDAGVRGCMRLEMRLPRSTCPAGHGT